MKNSWKIIGNIVMSVCFTVASVTGCSKNTYEFNTSDNVEKNDHSYSVSTSNDIATEVGMAVLDSGGNAVDAAVAISYTLAVVEPYASGLGGSGGMLVYDMNKKTSTLYDYRASAGSSTSLVDMVQIPGFVKGMEMALQDYGSISMSDLIQPAIDYAIDGFNVDDELARAIKYIQSISMQNSGFYNKNGILLNSGDTLVQNDLANTLQLIQQEGSSVFYTGQIAQDIAENCALTIDDISSYSVYKRNVVSSNINGYQIYSAGAPFSGITLIQMLKMAEMDSIDKPKDNPERYLEELNRVVNITYQARYNDIADPEFYTQSDNLLSDAYIQSLQGIQTYNYEDNEAIETTSFSVVDSNGLAVSCTNTLSDFWGSQVYVDGIILNDTGTNFSSNGINKYEPYKRSRTFTSPTILVKEDEVISIGTPGGSDVPQLLFQVIEDITLFDEEYQKAVDKSRVLYRNGNLNLETVNDNNTFRIDDSKINQTIVWKESGSSWGSVSLAGYNNEGAFGAYDFRRGATYCGTKN